MTDWTAIILTVTLIIVTGASAFLWDTHKYLRALPIFCGLVSGFVLSIFVWQQKDLWKIVETVLGFGFGGLVLYLSVWVQLRKRA